MSDFSSKHYEIKNLSEKDNLDSLLPRRTRETGNCLMDISSEILDGIIISGFFHGFLRHLPDRIRFHPACQQYRRSQPVDSTIRQRYPPLSDIDVCLLGKHRNQSVCHTLQNSAGLSFGTGRGNDPVASFGQGIKLR